MESRYLTHRIIPNIGATGVLIEDVAAVLEQFNGIHSIKAVLVGNTSRNTGCEAGLVTALEKKLKRKLHTIRCSFQNEFPFITVFKYVDGTKRSLTTFTGHLGKLCGNDFQYFPQEEFNTIALEITSILLQGQW